MTEYLRSDVEYDSSKINTHNFAIPEADSHIPYPAGSRHELGKRIFFAIFLCWELFLSNKGYSFLSTEISAH